MPHPRGRRRKRRFEEAAEGAITEERTRADRLGGQTEESRNRFVGALEGFDPQAAAERTAFATTTSALDRLSEDRAAARRFNNRRGIIGGSSELAAERDVRRSLGTELGRQGLQTAGLELSRIGQMGDVTQMDIGREERGRNRFLDLLSGERDRITAEENARRFSKAIRSGQPSMFERMLGLGIKGAGLFI